jgi:hypothetical protein
MNKAQVINMIAELKASEAQKTECGRRLISFYDSLAS